MLFVYEKIRNDRTEKIMEKETEQDNGKRNGERNKIFICFARLYL